jgi:hypothetical protein
VRPCFACGTPMEERVFRTPAGAVMYTEWECEDCEVAEKETAEVLAYTPVSQWTQISWHGDVIELIDHSVTYRPSPA